MPRVHPAAPPRLGSVPLWGTARKQSWLAAAPGVLRPGRWSVRQQRVAPSPQRLPGLNLGGARPRFPPCPDRLILAPPTSPNPERAGAAAGEVQPPVREAAVAREPLQPLPALAMGPGPQLLLPLALCVGLGALVTSAGASGVSRRGPTVTAKVTDWRAANCPRAGQGAGGSFGDWVLGVRGGEEGTSREPGMRGGRGAQCEGSGTALSGATWGR